MPSLAIEGSTQSAVVAVQVRDTVTYAADTTGTDTVAQASPEIGWPQSFIDEVRYQVSHADFLKSSQVGMLFYDLTADSVLYGYGEHQLMRPASVLKTLTASAALSQLGGSYQYQTCLYIKGEVADSVLQGDVYIVAGFDPRFGSDDMQAFVQALKDQGIYRIAGQVYTDVSIKDTMTLGNGWLWHWANDEIPLTPLLYNGHEGFMQKFYEYLDEEGILHPATFARAMLPSGGTRLLVSRTHSIDQILMRMLKESDNLYAESLFCQLGAQDHTPYADFTHGQRYIKRFIHDNLRLDPNDYEVTDGCGLSTYDLLSPYLIVRMLRYVHSNPNLYLHLYPSLPVAGQDGTLRNRMKSGTAFTNVHAKTGSVRRVVTLAGYCQAANGHEVCFAIFHQNVNSSRQARNFDDHLLQVLTR